MRLRTLRVEASRTAELEAIERFYREGSYAAGVQAGDRVVLAESEREVIALVRLVHEQGVLVLRGMRTRTALQRTGVGTQLLQAAAAAIGAEPCYCIPWRHLRDFYARIGFRELEPARAPAFLRERLKEYDAENPGQFCIMLRSEGAE